MKDSLMPKIKVSVSFHKNLLKEIDAQAKREAQSRSEMLRQSARLYLQRQKKWDQLFRLGDEMTKRQKLKQCDVAFRIPKVCKHR